MKKNKTLPIEQKYYAHYNADTGVIFSVNNFRDNSHSHAVELAFEQYERLATFKEKFTDYHVGAVVNLSGETVTGLISRKVIQDHIFKNNILKWIDEDTDTANLTVNWDEFNKQWVFVAADSLRQLYYDNTLPIGSILIFVTIGGDPDFLIRSIELDLKKLVLDKIIVGFDTTWESNIDKIAITASLSNLSYSLKIWKSHE